MMELMSGGDTIIANLQGKQALKIQTEMKPGVSLLEIFKSLGSWTAGGNL